jgi:SAM-dependent methyltransferase
MGEKEEPSDEQEYILGTDDEELIRLGFQHQVWGEQASLAWERAGFAPGDTLLDVGCGPGYASFDLAHLVGSRGRVLAVDASPRFIKHLRSQIRARGVSNITAEVVNVEELDLPEASVDGAFARWVLCYIKNLEAVVAGVARALKREKPFVVHDYCHYVGVTVAPGGEIFDRVFEAVAETFRIRGGDPNVASQLPGIMARCGLEIREINPIARVARPGSALWKWPETFFKNYLPVLVEMGAIDESEKAAFEREWKLRSNDVAAFFYTPPMVEIIGTKK